MRVLEWFRRTATTPADRVRLDVSYMTAQAREWEFCHDCRECVQRYEQRIALQVKAQRITAEYACHLRSRYYGRIRCDVCRCVRDYRD